MATKIEYLFFTEKVIRDEVTKKFTYVDIFEKALLPKEGVTYLTFSIVGKINSDIAGSIDAKIMLCDPLTNEVIQTSPLKGIVEPGQINVAAGFSLVKLDKAGKYPIRINVNDIEIDTKGLNLEVLADIT